MDILNLFAPFILIVPIFYFLIIRPEQMKRKKHQNMLENMSKGNEVVTTGGLHGKIVGLDKNIVVLSIAEIDVSNQKINVKTEISRSAIAFLKKGGELIEGE